ncbi:hypothetical protein ABZ192_07715 [Streptomyces sp. NPDC006235]|uniref:hypothetical protein n=1 Tax=Streptomyces sp. NPDC006235 TaxID=3156736 RepID=UPI0033A7939D
MDFHDLQVMLTTLVRLPTVDDQAEYVRTHPAVRNPARNPVLSGMYAHARKQGDDRLGASVEQVMKLLDLADQFGLDLAASLVKAGPGRGMIIDDTAIPLDDDDS